MAISLIAYASFVKDPANASAGLASFQKTTFEETM